MNEEEAWRQADALTIGFGALAVYCFAFIGICLLAWNEWQEYKMQKKN